MHNNEKARIAAEIRAFKNTDFSNMPELTDEQLSLLKPSHYRKMAKNEPIRGTGRIQIDGDAVK